MKKWTIVGLGLVAQFALASGLLAQGVPAVPAAPAPTKNIFSMLLPSGEQCKKLKECLCNGPMGDMLKSMAKPMAMMSGGLIGGKCGQPGADDIKKLKEEGKPEEGAAAEIKKSEAEAKARREAVRYLGTVDCNYWPDAKAVLINALRNDPNECVRFEAALSLGRGCCCNKEVMKSLKHSANGDDKDGSPAEKSDRVRGAAFEALSVCASIYTEPAPVKGKEGSKEGTKDARNKGVLGVFVSAASAPTSSTAVATPVVTMPKTAATIQPVGYNTQKAPTVDMKRAPSAPAVTPTRGFIVFEETSPRPLPQLQPTGNAPLPSGSAFPSKNR